MTARPPSRLANVCPSDGYPPDALVAENRYTPPESLVMLYLPSSWCAPTANLSPASFKATDMPKRSPASNVVKLTLLPVL